MKIQSNANSSKQLMELLGLDNEISLNILKYVNYKFSLWSLSSISNIWHVSFLYT